MNSIRRWGLRPTPRQRFNRAVSTILTVLWTPWRRTFKIDFMSASGERRFAYQRHRSLAAAIRSAKAQRLPCEIIQVRPVPIADYVEILDPRGELFPTDNAARR